MRPTSCHRCRDIFEQDLLLRTRILHIVHTEGEYTARIELDEALQEAHDDHEIEAWWDKFGERVDRDYEEMRDREITE